MDNEMKNGMRELSMDEMDKVSGGSVEGIVGIDGKFYAEDFIVSMAYNMTNEFGYDIAAGVICDMFGLSKNEIKRSGAGTAKEDMGVLLNKLFLTHEKVRKDDSTF